MIATAAHRMRNIVNRTNHNWRAAPCDVQARSIVEPNPLPVITEEMTDVVPALVVPCAVGLLVVAGAGFGGATGDTGFVMVIGALAPVDAAVKETMLRHTG